MLITDVLISVILTPSRSKGARVQTESKENEEDVPRRELCPTF